MSKDSSGVSRRSKHGGVHGGDLYGGVWGLGYIWGKLTGTTAVHQEQLDILTNNGILALAAAFREQEYTVHGVLRISGRKTTLDALKVLAETDPAVRFATDHLAVSRDQAVHVRAGFIKHVMLRLLEARLLAYDSVDSWFVASPEAGEPQILFLLRFTQYIVAIVRNSATASMNAAAVAPILTMLISNSNVLAASQLNSLQLRQQQADYIARLTDTLGGLSSVRPSAAAEAVNSVSLWKPDQEPCKNTLGIRSCAFADTPCRVR